MDVGFIADDVEGGAPERAPEFSPFVLPLPTNPTTTAHWAHFNNVTLPPMLPNNRRRRVPVFEPAPFPPSPPPPSRRSRRANHSPPPPLRRDEETLPAPALYPQPDPPHDVEPRLNPLFPHHPNVVEENHSPRLPLSDDAANSPRLLHVGDGDGNSPQLLHVGDGAPPRPRFEAGRNAAFDISSLNNLPLIAPPPRRDLNPSLRAPPLYPNPSTRRSRNPALQPPPRRQRSPVRHLGDANLRVNEVAGDGQSSPGRFSTEADSRSLARLEDGMLSFFNRIPAASVNIIDNNDNALPAIANNGAGPDPPDDGAQRNAGVSVESTAPPAQAPERRKRKRSEDDEAEEKEEESKKPTENAMIDDNDENCCTICLEPWTTSGKHQLSCLPCGHLFGRSCIDTWLRRNRVCPNCKISMRGKKAILIFGAPSKLQTVDLGELATLRTELEKERKEHDKTKKRMRDYRDHNNNLRNRLKLHATPSFGGPPASVNGPHQSLLALSNAAAVRSATTTATSGARHAATALRVSTAATSAPRTGSIESHFRRVLREPILREPIQDSSDFALRPNSFMRNRSARRPSMPSVANMFPDMMPTGLPNVSMLFTIDTNGGSKALAFDANCNVLFSEKRQVRPGDAAPHKVSRRALLHHTVRVQSRADIMGRVNDLAVARMYDSPFRGHVAVASQSKRVHVLSPSLDEVQSFATAAPPLSCWWSTTQPNYLISGLMNGMVVAFDLRNTARPLAMKKVTANGNVAVHSLAEVAVSGETTPVLLAGTPTRIEAITFGGFAGAMNMEHVARVGAGADEACCSLAVDGNQVLVSSRQSGVETPGGYGRHVVHQGVRVRSGVDGGSSLELGPPISGGNGLTGHRMTTPYERSALLCGAGEGEGTIVMSPDSEAVGMNKFTRAWEYRSGAWNSATVGTYYSRLSTMAVKAMPLGREMRGRLGRGVVAHLGDATLQVFAVAGAR